MHVHVSGIDGIKVVLYVIAAMGALNLLAMRYQNSSNLAASYANIFGLS